MIKKISIVFILSVLLAGCSALQHKKPKMKSGIKGRMICGEILLKDGYVYIYKSTEKNLEDIPFAVAGPTREDGYFEINIPPGKYYVIGKKRTDGTKSSQIDENDYFSYHGGNPVEVKEGKYTFVGLTSVKVLSKNVLYNMTNINKESTNILKGTVTYQGLPLDDAYVYLYLNMSQDVKGPGFMMTGPTKEDGVFEFSDLPQNAYYVIARKRSSKDKAGPILRGDYFGYYVLNPVNVKSNSITNINVSTAIKAGEIGELDEGPARVSKMYIRGKIKDKSGKPVEGMYVFAYIERVIGHKKPAYLSSKSDSDGKYILYFDKPGIYYIGAREFYGDSPRPFERYGLYEATPDHSITITEGKSIENIDFTVEPILAK